MIDFYLLFLFIINLFLLFFLDKFAYKVNLIDHTNARKIHKGKKLNFVTIYLS